MLLIVVLVLSSFHCPCPCPHSRPFFLLLALAPGSRYVITGTKDGHLQVADTASGDLVVDLATGTNSDCSLTYLAKHNIV